LVGRSVASMDRRVRVAMFLDWHLYYTASIANALADEADVLLVTREHGNELGLPGEAVELKRRLIDPRVELAVLRGRQSELSSFLEVRRIARLVRDFHPSVVHSQIHKDWRLLLAARAPGCRVPNVVTIHDITDHPGTPPQRRLIQRVVEQSLLRGANGYIVHGHSLASRVEKQPWYRPGSPVFSIPHGVLAQPAAQKPLPERPTVLFFGRMEYYKGLDVLIQAVEMCKGRLPDLRVIVAGRGPELERCRELAQGDDCFEWHEEFIADHDIPGLFARSSLVVLPYREASQSGVALLAFANRRAVVATDAGALSEAVDNGVTGAVVAAGDPNALARALCDLLTDPSRLGTMSDAAYSVVTDGRLSPGAIAGAHMDAYRSLIATAEARRDRRDRYGDGKAS
jgi:glycosyltransferase involved in cell wall biosynthesis